MRKKGLFGTPQHPAPPNRGWGVAYREACDDASALHQLKRPLMPHSARCGHKDMSQEPLGPVCRGQEATWQLVVRSALLARATLTTMGRWRLSVSLFAPAESRSL